MFDQWKKKLDKRDTPEEIPFRAPEVIEATPAPAPVPQLQEAPAPAPAPVAPPTDKSDSVELRVMKPESYEEVGSVADNLLAGCTVVLNFELLTTPIMVKMLDFLNGVTYCTDGEIKQVSKTTFIITPHANVDISDL